MVLCETPRNQENCFTDTSMPSNLVMGNFKNHRAGVEDYR